MSALHASAPLALPVIPRPLAAGLQFLPLAPLAHGLTLLARALAARHPGLIRRLGSYVERRFTIDPTDLPVSLVLHSHPTAMQITVHCHPPRTDVRIAGPLAALLGLVHGTCDGDALFFSRDLVIEGDTSAALALRNAIDDAELDLGEEIVRFAGRFGPLLTPLVGLAERRTGLPLSRAGAVE